MSSAYVRLFGTNIGTVSWNPSEQRVDFSFSENFQKSGIELSPLKLPLRGKRYSDSALPCLLQASLPRGFAKPLLKAELNPVEQLLKIGNHGMGALEFQPSSDPAADETVQLTRLAKHASTFLTDSSNLTPEGSSQLLKTALPAGGERAKVLVGWNSETQEFRTSQNELPKGFEHWLVKLDGVITGEGASLTHPQDNCRIEFAYSLMAREAGIEMTECRLHEEFGYAHFMTRRFDRSSNGQKRHVQSLAALAQLDTENEVQNSYETMFQISRRLGLPYSQLEQLFRRAVFNLLARNQDDEPLNVSFLMNRRGEWSLAPAYDLTFSYQANGAGTGLQKMSLNCKRDDFTIDDLIAAARAATVKPRKARLIIEEVRNALNGWSKYAFQAKVPQGFNLGIARQFRIL